MKEDLEIIKSQLILALEENNKSKPCKTMVFDYLYFSLLKVNKLIIGGVSKSYVVKLVETTKSRPKTSYYICERGAILNETPHIEQAHVFNYKEAAISIAEFINETYDFKATVVRFL